MTEYIGINSEIYKYNADLKCYAKHSNKLPNDIVIYVDNKIYTRIGNTYNLLEKSDYANNIIYYKDESTQITVYKSKLICAIICGVPCYLDLTGYHKKSHSELKCKYLSLYNDNTTYEGIRNVSPNIFYINDIHNSGKYIKLDEKRKQIFLQNNNNHCTECSKYMYVDSKFNSKAEHIIHKNSYCNKESCLHYANIIASPIILTYSDSKSYRLCKYTQKIDGVDCRNWVLRETLFEKQCDVNNVERRIDPAIFKKYGNSNKAFIECVDSLGKVMTIYKYFKYSVCFYKDKIAIIKEFSTCTDCKEDGHIRKCKYQCAIMEVIDIMYPYENVTNAVYLDDDLVIVHIDGTINIFRPGDYYGVYSDFVDNLEESEECYDIMRKTVKYDEDFGCYEIVHEQLNNGKYLRKINGLSPLRLFDKENKGKLFTMLVCMKALNNSNKGGMLIAKPVGNMIFRLVVSLMVSKEWNGAKSEDVNDIYFTDGECDSEDSFD